MFWALACWSTAARTEVANCIINWSSEIFDHRRYRLNASSLNQLRWLSRLRAELPMKSPSAGSRSSASPPEARAAASHDLVTGWNERPT